MDRGAWPFSVGRVICLVNSFSVCKEKREERREKRSETMQEKMKEKMKEKKRERREEMILLRCGWSIAALALVFTGPETQVGDLRT